MIKVIHSYHAKIKKEPHSTRYKDHILSMLPDWSEFSKGNEGRKDIFISNNLKVADDVVKTYGTQVGQEDAWCSCGLLR